MPANFRFCAVQIEVICLLLFQLMFNFAKCSFYKRFLKKNEHMFESRIFHNMLHEHVLHVVSHNVMRSNILCPWAFSKFKWWVRWVKKPFFPKFCTHPPLFPKIFFLYAHNRVYGVQRRKLAKQSALFVWNETSICDTSKKESKGDTGCQEESNLFHSV